MKRKQSIGEYFQFTRKDRIATLIIALVLLSTYLLPELVRSATSTTLPATDTGWIGAIRQLEKPKPLSTGNDAGKREDNDDYDRYVYDRAADGYNNAAGDDLFSFDPNTLTADGWKRLGLREKTIKTILNYLQKGGRFRKPADLKRIYGLKPGEFERIRPYIHIGDPVATQPSPGEIVRESATRSAGPREIKRVDINTGDSAAFEALPGIGAKLSARIIHFREKLGGFYSIEQVRETFGLADSTFTGIKSYLQLSDHGNIRQININTAGVDELKAHPYIRYNLANVIVNYRQQHGQFVVLEDLKKITLIDAALFDKIKVYLTTGK